ncbi:hypothetical protein STCU_02491 [Strigomonas culicis]|uniref:Uncharacterized protein n=1 Tax=Strigomonas culicis TaxID=28005 RepID=S9WAW9_9TRYP|nr:hypothetical protein STCU_02491 [Strigomonas culicis]|eukprot:EPY33095.1 hypothetical protein STCU_02491 [Strigomonas culicis]
MFSLGLYSIVSSSSSCSHLERNERNLRPPLCADADVPPAHAQPRHLVGGDAGDAREARQPVYQGGVYARQRPPCDAAAAGRGREREPVRDPPESPHGALCLGGERARLLRAAADTHDAARRRNGAHGGDGESGQDGHVRADAVQ